MKKVSLTQPEIDKLVVVGRRVVPPTVYGVGFNDVNFKTMSGGKQIWQYKLWHSVLVRCFSAVGTGGRVQCYLDSEICNEWLSFGNFIEWVNKEVGYSGKPKGFQLDKDIITQGNKVYSPNMCALVPHAVNALVTTKITTRGLHPTGVCFSKFANRYKASLSYDGVNTYIGYFDTPEEAFLAYKVAKEAQIKAVANQYKGVLKPAVYESLMNWEITS